jgi:hypothetical protein
MKKILYYKQKKGLLELNDKKHTNIRINIELYKKIEKESKKENRSITKQIEYILKKHYDKE